MNKSIFQLHRWKKPSYRKWKKNNISVTSVAETGVSGVNNISVTSVEEIAVSEVKKTIFQLHGGRNRSTGSKQYFSSIYLWCWLEKGRWPITQVFVTSSNMTKLLVYTLKSQKCVYLQVIKISYIEGRNRSTESKQYFSYIGGGNRSTGSKAPICRKSLIIFITLRLYRIHIAMNRNRNGIFNLQVQRFQMNNSRLIVSPVRSVFLIYNDTNITMIVRHHLR